MATCLSGESTAQSKNVHPSKIERTDSLFTIKLTQNSDVERLAVLNGTNDIKLAANAAGNNRLSFSYRYLSFGFNIAPHLFTAKNTMATMGKTTIRGFNAGFNFRHWQQSFSYNRTKGYYLENTADYRTGWTRGQAYIQFPDLVLKQYQGATAYNFNPQFSVNSLVTHAERQVKSAGSFIPVFNYRYYISDDQSPFTAGSVRQKSKTLELLAGPAYYYTFVYLKSFYASAGLSLQAGFAHTLTENNTIDGTIKAHQNNPVFRLGGSIGLGYNGKRFFSAIYLRTIETAFRQQRTTVVTEDNRTTGHISIGYRLNAPSSMKKAVVRMDQKLLYLKSRIKN
ncbi:DUF4421 family protein [Niabella yanshanensis]|uniref:DUF4421 family protein n=1 Tax=Niabella yanshanensis TaxID=577386 RepID=A0ABZ0W4G2_9BACT|nr:DUF4421 family protein [Niabella yanshanensis]WQD37839.1 DUF4421 family protein [Niabella yanshanensis]